MSKMKLFIWHGIRTDYTDGIGFAVAKTVEEAREAIRKVSEDWEWEAYKDELTDDYEIHDVPYGGWISGGG